VGRDQGRFQLLLKGLKLPLVAGFEGGGVFDQGLGLGRVPVLAGIERGEELLVHGGELLHGLAECDGRECEWFGALVAGEFVKRFAGFAELLEMVVPDCGVLLRSGGRGGGAGLLVPGVVLKPELIVIEEPDGVGHGILGRDQSADFGSIVERLSGAVLSGRSGWRGVQVPDPEGDCHGDEAEE
jgi:hypothetical protein